MPEGPPWLSGWPGCAGEDGEEAGGLPVFCLFHLCDSHSFICWRGPHVIRSFNPFLLLVLNKHLFSLLCQMDLGVSTIGPALWAAQSRERQLCGHQTIIPVKGGRGHTWRCGHRKLRADCSSSETSTPSLSFVDQRKGGHGGVKMPKSGTSSILLILRCWTWLNSGLVSGYCISSLEHNNTRPNRQANFM